MPADAGITAVFTADGHLSGSAGCNDYNATYTFDESGSMTVGPLGTTRKACPDAIMSLENSYLDALQGTSEWAIGGGVLTLTGTGGTVLSYAGPKGIEGSWTLLSIGGAQVPNDHHRHRRLRQRRHGQRQRRLQRLQRHLQRCEGDSLSVSELSVTRKACDLTISGIETLFLDATPGGLQLQHRQRPADHRHAPGLRGRRRRRPRQAAHPSPAPHRCRAAGLCPARVPPSADSIVGRRWQLVELGGSPIPAGITDVTITFAADGTVTGNGGCNDFSGTYTLYGTKLTMAVTAARRRRATAAVSAMEQSVIPALAYIDSATLTDGQLTLASTLAQLEVGLRNEALRRIRGPPATAAGQPPGMDTSKSDGQSLPVSSQWPVAGSWAMPLSHAPDSSSAGFGSSRSDPSSTPVMWPSLGSMRMM